MSAPMPGTEGPVAALAELIVSDIGVNVRPDQVVGITAEPGMEPIWRAVAAAAYRRGARYVDTWIFDPYVKHARLAHAPLETLEYRPPWWGQRYRAIADLDGANIRLSGPVAPALMDDIPSERLGLDMMPRLPEVLPITNEGRWNWIVAPGPSPGWAQSLYPEADAPLQRLWADIATVMRLDHPDPALAWRTRLNELARIAAVLTDQRFETLHFSGPRTDLRVGLLPGSVWKCAGGDRTVGGIPFTANLPTEEVFTAPDPARVSGTVAASRPLVVGGGVVEELIVRFEAGRAVGVSATRGAGLVEAMIARDEGAARLGEVALVDRESRVGATGTVFYDTLLDENAASHLAFGNAYAATVADAASLEAMNSSSIHIDFMIGSPAVDVTGLGADGSAIPLLREGRWQV